jgi:hypothetical protein
MHMLGTVSSIREIIDRKGRKEGVVWSGETIIAAFVRRDV